VGQYVINIKKKIRHVWTCKVSLTHLALPFSLSLEWADNTSVVHCFFSLKKKDNVLFVVIDDTSLIDIAPTT
jgi:hypothetical protein